MATERDKSVNPFRFWEDSHAVIHDTHHPHTLCGAVLAPSFVNQVTEASPASNTSCVECKDNPYYSLWLLFKTQL